jgi:hypothetical protein
MEADLGLGGLSQNEKDVLYAVISVIASKPVSNSVAKSDEIKSHFLVQNITQPTFHRSLKNLVARNIIAHAPNTKAGSYVIPSEQSEKT